MRKYQKSQCIEMIRTLEEAHSEIAKYIEKKEIDTASSLLGECQQAAISLGNTVETTEGEGTEAVSRLEAYCELIYKINEEIVSGENTNPRNVEKRLRKTILSAQSCINALPTKLEAVFLPYKASMWDSLESIWMAADEDPNCDAYVIPIPYYDRNPDGSFAQIHYEAVDFPDYVPITHYGAFDLEKHQPDIIVPEIEAIRTERLFDFEKKGIQVVPSARAVNYTMNRKAIRDLAAKELGVKTADYRYAKNLNELKEATAIIGFPCVIKPLMSSSGHGQSVVKKAVS